MCLVVIQLVLISIYHVNILYFQNGDECSKFKIQPVNVSESYYLGVIVVNGDIQYSENQFYKLLLVANVS